MIRSPYSVPWDEVVARLDTDVERGLTSEEAEARLVRVGPNRIAEERSTPWWTILLSQFADVLIWVLLAAAFVSGVVLGDPIDAVVILTIVVLNAVIGFVQEYRAADALTSLRELSAPIASVVRDGVPRDVDAETLVPGDLLHLEAGDRVPGDARLVEARRLTLEEAALTGESFPVRKSVEPTDEGAVVGDRTSMVHAGTIVASGRARAVVTSTGPATEMGRIAALLEEDEPPSPLQVELARIGRRIAVLAGVAAVVVFALGLLRQGDLDSLFLTAVALAVAAIPEGLPAVTTITLARGVRAMAEDDAIVRRLPAVEALGAAEVICTDKTGTLTMNEMRVQRVALAEHRVEADELPDDGDGRIELFAAVAALCSDVVPVAGGLRGDPTEAALLGAFHPRLVDVEQTRAAHRRFDELSFDSSRKRMTTLHPWEGGYLVAMKGAPEVVLERCSHVRSAGGVEPLDQELLGDLRDQATELAAEGLRTIAVAYRLVEDPPESLEDCEQDLTYLGVAGMSDTLRPEVRDSVETAVRAGISVVMVTGDHEVTARTIANELGMLERRDVVGGAELREMGDEELAARVEQIGAYARVDPADKVKIVRAWQGRSRIVAMTGDGVNDAPALRIADIGVAMGTGTDVSKDASDMVLADDDFSTIVAAVERGRAIFSNLKKVLYFLLSANISEIFVMLVGFLVFGGAGEPLLAVQLLWINLITDGLPAVALGLDPPPPGIMDRPPERDRNLLGAAHQYRLVWQGAVLSLAPLAMFAYGWWGRGFEWEYVRTMAFSALVVVQLFHSLAVRAQTVSAWTTPLRNPVLVAAIVGSGMLQWLVVAAPIGNRLFETVPISVWDWLIVVGASALPFVLVDAIKVGVRRWRPNSPAVFD